MEFNIILYKTAIYIKLEYQVVSTKRRAGTLQGLAVRLNELGLRQNKIKIH